MSERPLPCPFCGKLPKVFPTDPKREGNAWGEVRCVNGSCPAQPTVSDGAMVADERGTDAYKALAIKRWNKRNPHRSEGRRRVMAERDIVERLRKHSGYVVIGRDTRELLVEAVTEIERLRAPAPEGEALLDEVAERIAHAIFFYGSDAERKWEELNDEFKEPVRKTARILATVITPTIERRAYERAAEIAEAQQNRETRSPDKYVEYDPANNMAKRIAAAIRNYALASPKEGK